MTFTNVGQTVLRLPDLFTDSEKPLIIAVSDSEIS